MRTPIGLFSALILTLSGCASLTREQCQSINWYEQGKYDGMSGRPSQQFRQYMKSCAEHGIALNQDTTYEQGRLQGLKYFCSYESGRKEGVADNPYSAICPDALEAEFLRGFESGKRERALLHREEELKKRERELEKREEERKCTFNSQCRLQDSCGSGGICAVSKQKCTFQSDCVIEGICTPERTCFYR